MTGMRYWSEGKSMPSHFLTRRLWYPISRFLLLIPIPSLEKQFIDMPVYVHLFSTGIIYIWRVMCCSVLCSLFSVEMGWPCLAMKCIFHKIPKKITTKKMLPALKSVVLTERNNDTFNPTGSSWTTCKSCNPELKLLSVWHVLSHQES